MSLDVGPWVHAEDLERGAASALTSQLRGSAILAIAAKVRELQGQGRSISNFTIGDFAPGVFPVPDSLKDAVADAYRADQTNYPPAVGCPELRAAVRSYYGSRLGLDYPDGSVQVGSGARPPIYAAFYALVDPGDAVIYGVPSWNVNHYVQLVGGEHRVVTGDPDQGFMLTAEAIEPHLAGARLLCLNSPLNPAGTVFEPTQLEAIAKLVVAENRRRASTGERPLFILYDQVYWQLVFEPARHVTPVTLVPEAAAYTVHVDAISKCWAATGLRVGWAVAPPAIIARMKPLVGHMGAWAPRPEQIATASLLAEPELVDPFLSDFSGRIEGSLKRLADGFGRMAADGLPVMALPPRGALYLSVRFDLMGRTLHGAPLDDERLGAWLLEEAGVAVVPFTAFGYPAGSGFVRFSVGAVSSADIDRALERIETLLRGL
ncbi:MAG: aminotransferase class I/II-fold pyridoxal phosphate-dependent enzyme [Myxococcota bacterium]